jgi:hypothetical protein
MERDGNSCALTLMKFSCTLREFFYTFSCSTLTHTRAPLFILNFSSPHDILSLALALVLSLSFCAAAAAALSLSIFSSCCRFVRSLATSREENVKIHDFAAALFLLSTIYYLINQ